MMYIMKPSDKQELDAYRALGTLDELRERLANHYPTTDDYAPLPWSGPDLPDGQYSGLLEDDDFDPDWEEK